MNCTLKRSTYNNAGLLLLCGCKRKAFEPIAKSNSAMPLDFIMVITFCSLISKQKSLMAPDVSHTPIMSWTELQTKGGRVSNERVRVYQYRKFTYTVPVLAVRTVPVRHTLWYSTTIEANKRSFKIIILSVPNKTWHEI